MGDGERREPVGTVAEEAARLVQSLGGWAGTHAGAPPDGAHAQDRSGRSDAAPDSEYAGAPGCTCSCHRAGEAAACRLCPLCQGIALLRAVRPETLERVADLAATAAAALHDLADQRRADRPDRAAEDGHGGAEDHPAGEPEEGRS